ncbi:prolyl aminopeptidase (secreted protein) [Arthroderma uncinatum]|uniref:prolyl aminopeptidase (secreted protein) n=1 Tax=Arthroderma uncinatum TaxID=74035 RepID=UPI00144A9E95|nr:prolyl aminopeptidase (secreted protein) [Arthroderma uncinatum]KAF3482535.1 prolyl aminopeptidase (secreted protein) [Arthroderma uncinatum]
MRLSHSLLVYLVPLATALQAANFNVSKALAESHSCGSECQRRLNNTIPADVAILSRDFDFSFYQTAANFFSSLAPGEVLKFQRINPKNLTIDGGATAFRFQYTSLDFNGSLVPVTGFIAFPYTPHYSFQDLASNSSSRYRLAAFAHGTIGIFPGCAPSNGPALNDYTSWQPVLERGYAIVATDYAGLGNNYTSHKYLSFPAHASDVYYSVVAARKLFPRSFTKEWMTFGHSQGGGAAWKLAESRYVRKDPNYLGTVALAPATYFIQQLIDSFTKAVSSPSGVEKGTGVGFLPFLPTAAQRVIPSYRESILAPTLCNRVQLATKAQLCLNAVLGMSIDLDASQLVSVAGAKRDIPTLLKWEKMVAPAQGGANPAPIFVVQGLNDTAVSWNITVRAWKNSCHAGNELHLRLFPTQGHRPVLTAGAAEWLAWMDYRFETRGTRSGKKQCTKETRHPFNLEYVKAPTDEDLKPFLK